MPLYAEALRPGGHVLAIGAGKIAAGKAEVVDGVQQVGLADPIRPANTDDALAEFEACLVVVFEIGERYGGELKQRLR